MAYRPKLFVGIDLDERTRARCAEVAARVEAQGVAARFEPAEKLHITLAFLGWVDAEQVEPVRDVMRAVAAETARFTITLDKLGAFPHERNPHIVWIGAREQGAAFRDLARAMRERYNEIGFHFDKDAIAHVTIARIREQHVHLPLLDVKPMRLSANELTLFESFPAARTTRYEVRERARLR